MNLLLPKIPLPQLRLMLALTAAGAPIGLLYGLIHDQVTYTISAEYFTKLKFTQFSWANVGFSPRLYAGEIGAIAVGWVGACAAWLLARLAVPAWPPREAIRHTAIGFCLILIFAFAGSLTGFLLGRLRARNPDFSNWNDYLLPLEIQHPEAFIHVAYIHNASYLRGLIGLVVATAWLIRKRAPHRRERGPLSGEK